MGIHPEQAERGTRSVHYFCLCLSKCCVSTSVDLCGQHCLNAYTYCVYVCICAC